jgi:hypothetical protein
MHNARCPMHDALLPATRANTNPTPSAVGTTGHVM